MDFEAIWHAHKPFIVKVGAGALVFLILTAYQGSVVAEAEQLAGANRQRQGHLLQGIDALMGPQGEAYALGRAEALQARLQPAILEAILWEPDDAFVVPKGDTGLSPRLYYVRQREEAVKRVDRAAGKWNAQVPRTAEQLGLGEDVEDARLGEALAQADVVQRLMVKLIDAGVRRVRDLDPLGVGYEQLPGVGGYLRAVPVEVAFEADAAILAVALAELQEQGSFLEVRKVSLEREGDRPGAAVLARLEVQALSLVDEPPATAKAAPAGGPATPRRPRGPVRFQRER